MSEDAQYRDLVALYGSYGDEELVSLARGMDDLTPAAQEALKGELARRGLKAAPAEKVRRILTEDDLADMRSYAEMAPAECIFDFETERAASAAYYALTAEGIEAIVVSPGRANGPRVVVKPKDAERASEILSAPPSEALTDETTAASAEYDIPRCPACESEEIVLESVDPVNQWLCDACGHTWLEEPVSQS
jgi:hypothetical protein